MITTNQLKRKDWGKPQKKQVFTSATEKPRIKPDEGDATNPPRLFNGKVLTIQMMEEMRRNAKRKDVAAKAKAVRKGKGK